MSNRGESENGGKGGKKSKTSKSRSSRGEANEVLGKHGPRVVVTTEADADRSIADKTVPGRSCKSCYGPDSGGMVQCDECSKWHHFTCVGVTEEVENQSWSCPKCVSAKWIQREESTSSKNLQPKGATSCTRQEAHKSVHADNESISDVASRKCLPKVPSAVKSISSKRSSKTLLKLQMEKLDEERRLEREYLDKKYALLQEMASEDGSSYTSSVTSSMNRVRDWVKSNNLKDGPRNSIPFEPQRNSTQYQPLLQQPDAALDPVRLSTHMDQLTIGRTFSFKDGNLDHLRPAVPVNICQNPDLTHGSTMRPSASAVSYHCRQQSAAIMPDTIADRIVHRQEPSIQHRSHHVEDLCPLSNKQIAARQAVSKDLPLFSGKPDEWPIFFSAFTNTTTMCGFTDGENTTRLQKCLSGKAYDAVKSLLMHPSNVNRVISTLRMRFGQPEAIVHSLIEKINSLPALREDKLETIMDFAVEVQNFCSVVDACGLEEHMYDVSLLHQLVSKLPPSIKLDWAKHRLMFSKVNMATFGNWLYSLAEAASSVTIPGVQDCRNTRSDTRSARKGTGFLHAHLESESSSHEISEPQRNFRVGCLVCKGDCDSITKCKQFLDLSRESKWAVVKEFSLCRRCLRKHSGNCEAKVCGKDGCAFKHHQLLHKEQKNKQESTSKTADSPSESSPTPDSERHGCNIHGSSSSSVLFRYLPVVIHSEKKSIHTFAFLDDGSELTLLDHELANELGLEGAEIPLNLRWTGGTERCEKDSRITSLSITGDGGGSRTFNLKEVRTVKELQLPYQSLNMAEMRKRYPHLRGLPIESYEQVRPKILIGMKHVHVTLVLQCREGKPDQPVATKTRLGWTVCGASYENSVPSMVHYSFHVGERTTSDEDLHQAMKEYFSLDNLGVAKPSQSLLSSEDQRAYSLLATLTNRKGNRYETGLLWRFDDIRLPNNRPMALHRHHLLVKRLQKDPELATTLNQKIADYRQKGYIRKLQKEEESHQVQRSWYLPVFPVVNINKPGKTRIVWDAAATSYGVSLNSALLKGPDQLCSLFEILLQFRKYRIGITGDIREMFHQVQIREEDRACQRFFWNNKDGTTAVYEMCVMTFGACCSPSTAQYIKNMNADRFSEQYPQAVEAITKQHYVDDMLTSVESEEDAIQLAQDVKYVHSQGGFEIRNWISNSEAVIKALGECEATKKCLDLSADMSVDKVLGLWWCTESDTFTFKVGWNRYDEALLKGQRRPTKREVLRVLMTIFDPLGFIAHFLIFLKVLLQEIWRSGVQWDDEINNNLLEKWKTWLRILPAVEQVQIPRCYRSKLTTESDVQLHTFVDASETAFAAVSFLRFTSGEQVECLIVASKTRVAPLKFQSIPRLELQAAVLGIRLAQSITEALSIRFKKRYFWSDSRDVICWINSDHRRFSPFVAHRVSEILDTTETSEWFWIPSKMNVADDATKWTTQPDLSSSSRWFRGPDFLWQSEEEWPAQPLYKSTIEEARSSLVGHLSVPTPPLIYENFSSWTRLTRVVAFVYRFINSCRLKKQKLPNHIRALCSEELKAAELCVLRLTQQEAFAEELTALHKRNPLPKSSSIVKLSPWLDDQGMLRVLGRTSSCFFISKDAKKL